MRADILADRDTAIFATYYAEHYVGLVRLATATTMSTELAEEIVQDAFVAAYKQWDRIEFPNAWLRRAVLNKSTSWVRRQMVERRLSPPAEAEPLTNLDVGSTALLDVMRRLPATQRAVVFLKYYEDFTEREIADLMGCAVGTVKSRLSRARDALREEFT